MKRNVKDISTKFKMWSFLGLDLNIGTSKILIDTYIYIYIYTHTHTHIYVYIYTEGLPWWSSG